MFVHLPHIRNSSLRWAIYIACLFFVLSYIAFDVLDLDGSDFLRAFNPVEGTTIIAVVPTETRLDFSRETFKGRHSDMLFFADRLRKYGRSRPMEIQDFFPVDATRAHGYRVGLARNSLSDSSPYF